MRHSRMLGAAILAAAILFPATAGAHVHLQPENGPAGSWSTFSVTVPHGCDGSPTTGITIQIPEQIMSVTPAPLAGWTLSTTMAPVDPPVVNDMGTKITSRVNTVTWSGGSLPDHQLAEFRLQLALPDTVGTTLDFPTIQTCVKGENRWIQIPAAGQTEDDVPAPAPTITIDAADTAPAPTTDSSTQSTIAIVLGAAGSIAGIAALAIVLIARRTKK